MRKKLIGGVAIALASAGLGAFAATGFGGGDTPAHRSVNAGPVALEVVEIEGTQRATAHRRGTTRRRGPVLTHLITRSALTADPLTSTYTPLSCPAGTGNPVTGGALTDGRSDVAIDVISRFNPNNLRKPRNRFFVGVRNDHATESRSFRATLVCGKRMRIR